MTGRVLVRDASGAVVLSEPESYLIAIEEPPK